jgi:hypothetical protein
MSPTLMITLLLVARDRVESSLDGSSSAKQQHDQNNQQYESDPATPVAKSGTARSQNNRQRTTAPRGQEQLQVGEMNHVLSPWIIRQDFD